MNFLRKATIFLASSLLPLSIITFGILFSVFQVLGSPGQIQKALDKSGVYNDAVASIVEENATQVGATTLQQSDAEAAVQKAVSESVPESYVKEQTGEVLKGISAWLNGDTKTLDFAVDLNPVKSNLVDNLTEQARQRAESLPRCTSYEQLTTLDANDVFSLTCLPPGVTPEIAAEQTRHEILGSELFDKATIGPTTLVGDGGEPIEEQLRPFKTAYQVAKQVMYITGVASIIGIAIIIWLSRPRWVGVKRVAYILITAGITGIITALITKIGIGAIVRVALEKGSGASGSNITDAAQHIVSSICNIWLGMGIAAVVVGIGCLVGVKSWNKKHQDPADAGGEHKINQPPAPSNNLSKPTISS